MVKHLEWDSQFFGFKVGSLVMTSNMSEDYLLEILNKESSSFRLIYVFLSEQRMLSSGICKECNIALADQKVIFQKELTSSSYNLNYHEQIESVMYRDHTNFKILAIASGVQSRFRLDPHFSRELFERMYEEWVKNSLNGQIADQCYAYIHENLPIGIVTIKQEIDFTSIGIIAIDSNFRGKGLGNKLLYAAEKYSNENKFSTISVATQQRNRGACLFYHKNGYLTKSITNIYHFWNNEYHPFQ